MNENLYIHIYLYVYIHTHIYIYCLSNKHSIKQKPFFPRTPKQKNLSFFDFLSLSQSSVRVRREKSPKSQKIFQSNFFKSSPPCKNLDFEVFLMTYIMFFSSNLFMHITCSIKCLNEIVLIYYWLLYYTGIHLGEKNQRQKVYGLLKK